MAVSGKWKILLACGHWAAMTRSERDARRSAGVVYCSTCESSVGLTAQEKRGGLSQEQTARRLAREEKNRNTAAAQLPGASRTDGLMFRQTSEAGRGVWWCRWCDGVGRPPDERLGRVGSFGILLHQWENHKRTPLHLQQYRMRHAGGVQ